MRGETDSSIPELTPSMTKEEWATMNVKVRPSTKARMDRVKIIPDESYDAVITRALDALEAKA